MKAFVSVRTSDEKSSPMWKLLCLECRLYGSFLGSHDLEYPLASEELVLLTP